MLALIGWGDRPPLAGGWSSATPSGMPLVLAPHDGSASARPDSLAASADGLLCTLVSGALSNRHELAATLAAPPGGRLDDAHVLAALYQERGGQCVSALRGAFAFALWDGRRGQLILGRDHMGLVPLYVSAERASLAASSSLPALLALPGVAGVWDAAALSSLLTLGCVPAPATLHPGVRQLRPGELLVWEEGRSRRHRYWQLRFPDPAQQRTDAGALIRERLGDALRLQQAGVVSAAMLSGGLGSAMLLAAAADARRVPARALTVPLAAGDARGAARTAARHGVEHAVVDEALDWAAWADRLLATTGIPDGGLDGAVLAPAFARAGAGGVVLSGHGADEVMGGAQPFREWLAVIRFRALPGPLREVAELWARVAPHGAVARRVVDAPLAPVAFWAARGTLFAPREQERLLTPEAMALVGEMRAEETIAGLFADAMAAGASDPLDAIHHVALQLRLSAVTALRAQAAVAGVDLRCPFVDHRLAQVVTSVQPRRRATWRARQLLLREALPSHAPRPGAQPWHEPPAPPRSAWATGSLRDLVESALAPSRLEAAGVFRPDAVARLRAEQDAGVRDHGARLWMLVLTSQWLERLGWPQALSARAAI